MSKNQPHARILLEDLNVIKEQDPCICKLYFECVSAERYGSSFKQIAINMSEKSFRKAKAFLEQGYFEFKPICGSSASNRLTVKGWTVRNLRGIYSDAWIDPTEYNLFLQSDYWKQVREWVLQRDNNTCKSCGATKYLQVHHLTYEHHGREHEYLEDLVTVCRGCHERIHNRH